MLQKIENIKETLLITHLNCTDGSGCALMYKEAGGLLENIRFVPAGGADRFIQEKLLPKDDGRFIIMADVGISDPKCADIIEKRGEIVLLDHHKTSLHLNCRPWCSIEMGACGTELLRKYLGLDKLFQLKYAEVVDDFDRWIRNLLPDSEDLSTFHAFIGQDDFIKRFTENSLESRWNAREFWLTSQEEDLLQIIKKKRDESIHRAVKHVKIKDVVVGEQAVKIGYTLSQLQDISLLLDKVLFCYPELDVAASINIEAGTVSLRSKGETDVAEIAKLYGGGGHKNAAGHPLPNDLLNELIDGIHN